MPVATGEGPRCACEADHVERAVVFFVEMIVSLQDVDVASCFHGFDLLDHLHVSAGVFVFENLHADEKIEQKLLWQVA